MPGGPGIDAAYYQTLIEGIEFPGTVWFLDFPGNGTHTVGIAPDYDFDNWFDLFLPCIAQFENPVFVGHSFSGMFPLLFPELEHCLKGMVIVSGSPCLWLDEAQAYAKMHGLPDISSHVKKFIEEPSDQTLKNFLEGALPYFFPPQNLKKGREFLAHIYWRFQPGVWWQRKAIEIEYHAKWIPQEVPTLLICGLSDGITPAALFEKDKRFRRPNIELCYIEEAGHFPWVDKPEIVKNKLREFINKVA